MSAIDWTDPDEMLGLLIEYVADEAAASHGDADRARFLAQLSGDLSGLAGQDFESVDELAHQLRDLHDEQPREFAADPVLSHVTDCVEELRRIGTVHR
ncbi:MAG: hypothetical protein ABI779_06910 [Acidobacteriota bacterium]